MRRMFLLGLLFPALLIPLQRQRPTRQPPPQDEATRRWPLAEIKISGNKVFPSEKIVLATGLKPGDSVNAADLERATGRLTDTGVFETLSFRYTPVGDKLSVTFEVQEVIDLYPVGFERLDIADSELARAIGEKVPLFGPQVPATGVMVKRIVEALESYLASHGKSVRVLGRLVPAEGGKLVMTFRPAEAPPSITFVKFENSSVLRAEDLHKAFYQVAVGVPYLEARLHELLDHNIRPLFEEKGRLRVRFGPLRVEDSKEPVGVVVTVPVNDGDEFQFNKVELAGHSKLPEKDVARLVRLQEGELANFALVKHVLGDIERLYRRNGFMHATTEFERTLNDEKKTVDVVIRIRERDQYLFRTLEIKGLDINAAAAVRRRWALQRGQPFDDSYPEVFLKRIHDEAMFERLAKTTHKVTVEEESKSVDVELMFHGEPAARKTRVVP